MDTLTKNENLTSSERLNTFSLVYAFPHADNKTLKSEGIKKGFYVSLSDATFFKQGLMFLRTQSGFETLPSVAAKLGTDSKLLKVWNKIVENPTMDSAGIMSLNGIGKDTTNRVAISWFGSVLEFLEGTEEYKDASKAFREGHKALSVRAHGGRTASPEKQAEKKAKVQALVSQIVNNYSVEQLNAMLSARGLKVLDASEVNDTPMASIVPDAPKGGHGKKK